jgi:hypothetical protein
VALDGEVLVVAERVTTRLHRSVWDTTALQAGADPQIDTAAEVAVFALELAGKRRQARRGGRFARVVVSFALAACVALSSVAAACDKPNASPEATQTAINALPSASGATVAITAQPRASPAQFTDLLLVDAGSDAQPWAVLQVPGSTAPVLVDRVGAGLDSVGATYRLAALPVSVGTRDGPSQFLDPLQPAVTTGGTQELATAAPEQVEQAWAQDERYLAATRAIAGQPTVLDAAYNATAAADAGGTHTYLGGVVLRVEPDAPVLGVIDRALLESGLPTRAEDVVYVAIRASEQSLYNPGQVVNLRDVVVDKQTTDVNGQPATVYVANAALDGARVEPTGSVDLQSLLQPRLQRVDQDLLAVENQPAPDASSPPAPTVTPGPTTSAPAQPIIVQQRSSGPSLVDDFLIWMWLSNGGFYRGPSVVINNPPRTTNRPSGNVYYSPPPAPSGASPSTVSSAQAASRSTALEASRSAVSGQASGTGGGVAATNKSAADTTARVSAATAKSASVAAGVSASSTGKSVASLPSGSSTTASRSAGTTSAGTRGSAGSSSSGSSSGSSSSSGGKGIGGASSSSGGGFGGKGSSGGGSTSS